MTRIYQPLIITIVALALLTSCEPNSTTDAAIVKLAPAVNTTNPGSVRLLIGASLYRTHDTILITLSNQSPQTIHFPDHLTNCSVILLQHQINGNWQAVNTCRLAIPTRLHALEARQSLPVNLAPPRNGWLPGLYRATLRYRTSLLPVVPTTIYSIAFQIA